MDCVFLEKNQVSIGTIKQKVTKKYGTYKINRENGRNVLAYLGLSFKELSLYEFYCLVMANVSLEMQSLSGLFSS